MKTEIREITPATAKEMLKRNINNRPVSRPHVGFLSREMKAGNWCFDGQPIRLSEGGAVLDGQHRLEAIIESATVQTFLIIKGIETKAFQVMDTGRNRTSGDVFAIEGIENSTTAAATTRVIIKHFEGSHSQQHNRTTRSSNTEVLEYYKRNKDIGAFVKEAKKLNKEFNKFLSVSQIGAFSYIMAKKNTEVSSEFWKKLCSGVGIVENSAIHALRNRLISDKLSNQQIKNIERVALIFKAWNKHRKNEQVKVLFWNAKNEKFPTLI